MTEKELEGTQVQSKTGELAIVTKVTLKGVELSTDEGVKKLSIHSFRRNWSPAVEVEDEVPVTEIETTEAVGAEVTETEVAQTEDVVEDILTDEVEAPTEPVAEVVAETEEVQPVETESSQEVVAEVTKPKKEKVVKERVVKEKDITLEPIHNQILEYAESIGCELKETFKYTAIRFNEKNIAELHYSRKGLALVVSSKSLTPELNSMCVAFPANYNWILDTKYSISAENLNNAFAFIEAGVEHIKVTKPVKVKKQKQEVAEVETTEVK